MLEEQDSRLDPDDHRVLANRLDLLHFQDEAPGMVFWHPRGFALYRVLEAAARAHVLAAGYREVRTPQLVRRPIWEASGHWAHFRSGMFAIGDGNVEAALKPVNCPGHIQIVKRMAPSWRDLPIRIAEMGLVHRDEAGGTLHGLLRLRQFTQDDGHVFCSEAQIADEVARFCRDLPAFYRRFGFTDVSVVLSTRPAERAGDDAWWDRAEAALAGVIDALALPHEVAPGGGAFYGPKLEFVLHDRRGRPWQCGTIQLDLVMPHQFDVRYVTPSGEREHVVMLHRALYGSIERFLGILLEHHRGALPAWLAPEQVAVVPIADAQHAQARQLADQLAQRGLRVRIDADSGATLARRVAIAHHDGVPLVAVIGAREVETDRVALRAGGERLGLPREAAIDELVRRCGVPA